MTTAKSFIAVCAVVAATLAAVGTAEARPGRHHHGYRHHHHYHHHHAYRRHYHHRRRGVVGRVVRGIARSL